MRIADYITRLKIELGPGWRETAIDQMLSGDPGAELRGVAVAMMATQEVLEAADRAGCNLVVTHEPVFFSHQNNLSAVEGDAVYEAKLRFLKSRGISVFHLHDNVHLEGADLIALGMSRALDWESCRADDSRVEFDMPGRSLGSILGELQAALGPAALRYIGDPDRVYGRVLASWGFVMMPGALRLFARSESAILVAGETHEWELAEYVRDARALGFAKALVIVGHLPSEEKGFLSVAELLRSACPGVPVVAIPTGDLFARAGSRPPASAR
jgi:Uncharacterized conserved protein